MSRIFRHHFSVCCFLWRCGNIPKCGRDLWSAVRGPSLSRTASSCSCRLLSWPACSNVARRWESRSYSTSTPSHLIRSELLPGSLHLFHPFRFSYVLTAAPGFCLCVTASSHPSLHHVGPGRGEETRTKTCWARRGERGKRWWRSLC